MKKTVRDLYLLTGLALATAGLVVAQNAEEPAQPTTQESATPPANEPAEPAREDANTAPGADVDDEFIPTEEILADEEVTFPVDI
jgi:hypothetical protein